MKQNPILILGITGASGVELSYHTAQALHDSGARIHMVISDAAKLTWDCETKLPFSVLTELADCLYDMRDFSAPIASGSFETSGMLIVPCSMKTLAGVASGYADNLLLRAADVCLKEERKLVLCPREMPLSRLHLRNLKEAADLGCTIVPPMLTFYSGQQTMQDQIDQIVGRLLLPFGLHYSRFRPWQGSEG